MPKEHDHPGDSLHFACPACRERVEADQAAAELAEGQERHCVWTIDVLGDQHTIEMVLPVPAGWSDDEVFIAYTNTPHPSVATVKPQPKRHPLVQAEIDKALPKLYLSEVTLAEAFEYVMVVDVKIDRRRTVGVPVQEPDHPSLFE